MKIARDAPGSFQLVLFLLTSLLLLPGSARAEPSSQPWLQLAQTNTQQQPGEKAEPEEERRKQKQDRARRPEDDRGQSGQQQGPGRAEERKQQGPARADEDRQRPERGRAEEKQKQDRGRAEQEQKQREDRQRADQEKQRQDRGRAEQEQKQREDRQRADQEKQRLDRGRAEQEQKQREDRQRADQEKQRLDRGRAEEEQKQREDRQRADQEKEKQDRAGAEQRQVEQERARLEAERQKQQEERARLERDRARGAKEAVQERERRLQAEEERLRAAEEQLRRREDRFREDRGRLERAERRLERLEDVQKQRRERVEADGKRKIIEEPDRRVIIRENGRAFIRHDETDRLARLSRDTRVDRRRDGITLNVFVRPGGVEVISEVDEHGRLLRRYRRDRSGREIVLIDNREFFRNRGRRDDYDVFVELPPPRIEIPRRKYIVDYSEASREDIYEALTAPPVERIERRYSMEEVRRSHALRERMRRVDLDDINFEFGSWEVTRDQLPKLERLARVINSILERRPSEVFLIEGHTDAVGSDEDNLSLSDRRAEAVAVILSDQFEVPPENLTTQGYGEQYLKVDTQEAERLNRRVAVRRITPLLSRNEQEGRLDRRRR